MKILKYVIASFIVSLFAFIPRYFVFAADLDNTITGGVSYQFAYDWAYSHQVPGVIKTDNIVITPFYNYTNNGSGAFNIIFLSSSDNVNLNKGTGSYYSSSPVTFGSYVLYKSSSSTWDFQGITSSGSYYLNLININQSFNDVYSRNNTFTYNGNNVITPPPTYETVDNFSVISHDDTFSIDFSVAPTSNSLYNGNLLSYQTSVYVVSFDATINGTKRILQVPIYSTYLPQKSTLDLGDKVGIPAGEVYTYKVYALQGYTNYLRSCSLPVIRFLPDDPLAIPAVFNANGIYSAVNTISIYDLLSRLQELYPDDTFVLDDLLVEWGITFFDVSYDNEVAYNTVVDWSSYAQSDVPPDDPYRTKLMQSIDNLYNQLGSNSYNWNIINGSSSANPFIYETSSLPKLQNIDYPDITWESLPDDPDTVSFFAWLVQSVYTSPFGLIAVCALSFLLLKTIMR